MAPPPLRQFASTSALPSRYVTEDTPADLLEGTMDLTVILPAGHNVNMQVHRSTPMMDLLIQVTTAHKINPGGHVIHVVSDNRLLSYKASTPIGTLDTSVIQIVPKNKVNDAAGRKNRAHLNTQAIEKNLRLKVNLPRNQLAVYRVPPKTLISDVLELVCKEKGLDINNYEIRHPINVDEKLRGVCNLSDYQLQEVTVVPRDYRAPPLSVTDLITMAAISHPEDKKRKGIFSIFSRKTKTSSTGDSSLSSGSAGERSVSPARSDESVDGRPPANTNRPLSHASSTTTLINAPLPPIRPRKRQAPAPPPVVPNSLVNGKSDEINNRVEIEKRNGSALSRNSSNSSDQRSSLLSGVDSELSNSDGSRPTTNLTSVVSTSSLSLVSRGKRRAPVPPKPPPPQDENSRPSAIPEETDSVHSLPSQDPKIVEESRVKLNGESPSSPPSQAEPLTSSPSSPSSSSFVSSVSSLSSVEHQASTGSSSSSSVPPVAPQEPADSNSVDPPPPPESDAPPPPVTECSTNSEAENVNAVIWSPFTPTNDIAQIQFPTTVTHQNTSTVPQLYTNNAPSHASLSSAADNTGELHHQILDLNSNHISSNTHHIYSDRLAATTDLSTTHQQQNSYHHYPLMEDIIQTKAAKSDKSSRKRSAREATNSDILAKQSKEGSGINSQVVIESAKLSTFNQSTEDTILPQGVKNENLPEIPTFRLVTKSHTAVKSEEDTKKKFIADGKQQMVGDDFSGTFGKSSTNPTKNSLSRGNILTRQEKLSDVDDDLDIDEDMFEPRDFFGTSIQSVDLSQLGNPVNSSTPERSINSAVASHGTKMENNILLKTAKTQAPQPAPRATVKSSPPLPAKHKTRSSSSSSLSSMSSESDGASGHKNKLNGNFKNDIVINSSLKDEKMQVIKPKPPPRKQNLVLNKSHPDVPRPQIKKVGSADSNSSYSSVESKDGKDAAIKVMSGIPAEVNNMVPATTVNLQMRNQGSTDSSLSSSSSQKITIDLSTIVVNKTSTVLKASSVDSNESTDIIYHGNLDLSNRTGGNEIGFDQRLEEQSAEDFKVHVSKLSSVDVDMLSLLSEEGVDGGTSSNSSSTTTAVASNASTLSKGSTASKEIKNELKDSFEPKVQKPPEPPKIGLAIGGTSGNIRAGFLAMMEQLKDWDSSEPINNITPKEEYISEQPSSRKSSTSESENSSIQESSKDVINSDTESVDPQEGFIYGKHTNPLNQSSNIKNWKNSESLNTLGIDASDTNRSSFPESTEKIVLKREPKTMDNSKGLPPGGLRGVVDASTLLGGDASGSSMCSDSDNEVQSRTASFSSESSEESHGSKQPMNDPIDTEPATPKETETSDIHNNIPETIEPISLNQIPKQEHILNEQNIHTNKIIRERSYSSVSTSSGSSYESTARKEIIIQEVNSNKNVLNGVDTVDKINLVKSITELSNSVKKTNIPKHEDDECDSGTVSDSSQDQDIVIKQTIKPKLEEKIVKEELKTEILEVPLPVIRIPESDSNLESSGILGDHKLILDKQPSASSGSRKDSVSSMSSVSSYESSNKVEKIKLSAQRSQELSKRDIESQLQEAFANLEGETQDDLNVQDLLTKKEIPCTLSKNNKNNNDSSNWEYKIPAPPAGFNDGSADDSSSVSSDSTQEGHIKISSGFNDSQPSSYTEAKNPALVAEITKVVELPTPGESTDFNTFDGREIKDITEEKNIVNDGSKKIIINELKHTLKEANNNEPRIVNVKPKVPITTVIVPTKRVNQPTELQAPRKDSVNSVSSYESCGESSDLQKVIARDQRSPSDSSYDSAPPPIPETTYPEDIEVRTSRSSSISSSNSAASNVKTKPAGMNFSISTYTTRAEEISYDKKIVKSESFSHQVRPVKSNLSKAESFTAQYKTDFSSNVLTEEKEDMKEVPFQSSQTNKFITSDSQLHSSSLGRVSSFNEKSNSSKNTNNDNFLKPELPRHPLRFQHGEISEPLERTASMVDLTHPQTNLRRAQSDIDVTGSGIRDPSMVPMMPDSRLAEEFVKLQQDFFRWQQQLLQNQHLLHSRVAPLASNPPSLQSVGVLRDIMSQSTSNLSESRGSEKLKSERVIDVKVERETQENNSDEYQSRGSRSLSRPWLSQSVQDVSGNTEESSITTSDRKTYTSQPARRWGEEPNVTVGAWGERPSQAVGVQQDKDHYTSTPRSRSTQDLTTAHIPEGRRWTPPKTFIAPQPFSRSQAENVGFESKPYHRNQQPQIQPQTNNTDQSASEVFWKELQARRAAFGLQESDAVEEPTRPPRRTQSHLVNGDTTHTPENENSSKPLTYFGQSNGPSEPQCYYYNGERTAPSALSKVANNAAVSRPRDVESDPSSARYTSVVTLSSDKSSQDQGTSAPKDKVRSVVQLSNSDHRPQLRPNPVVRGFRQPVEEKQGTFQSRIITNSVNTQPTSQPQQVRHKSPPPLSHGYSAPQLASNPAQYSHSSTSYHGPTASRLVSAATDHALRNSMVPSGSSSPALFSQGNPTTAASAGATFPSVKLRPVTNTSPRSSPPAEIVAPSVASTTSSPPAPPPAPVAPPPPPPPASAPSSGERRTASGKRIMPAKKGPTLDPREELMIAIRSAAGGATLRKTRGN